MALGTSIAAGSGSGHTQGENGELKFRNIWKKTYVIYYTTFEDTLNLVLII